MGNMIMMASGVSSRYTGIMAVFPQRLQQDITFTILLSIKSSNEKKKARQKKNNSPTTKLLEILCDL